MWIMFCIWKYFNKTHNTHHWVQLFCVLVDTDWLGGEHTAAPLNAAGRPANRQPPAVSVCQAGRSQVATVPLCSVYISASYYTLL